MALEAENCEIHSLSHISVCQLSLLIEYWPVWQGSVWGLFTCFGWQVTLCESRGWKT